MSLHCDGRNLVAVVVQKWAMRHSSWRRTPLSSIRSLLVVANDDDPTSFDVFDCLNVDAVAAVAGGDVVGYDDGADGIVRCAADGVHDLQCCWHFLANLDFVHFDYCCFRCLKLA